MFAEIIRYSNQSRLKIISHLKLFEYSWSYTFVIQIKQHCVIHISHNRLKCSYTVCFPDPPLEHLHGRLQLQPLLQPWRSWRLHCRGDLLHEAVHACRRILLHLRIHLLSWSAGGLLFRSVHVEFVGANSVWGCHL